MTLRTLMTTSALGLLLATSATAQTGTDAAAPSTTAPAEDAAPMATDGATMEPQNLSEMTVGDLNGTDVIDASGETIGTIKDVVQGPSEGEAIVGIGGFLGLGQYEVALPLSDLTYEAEAEAVAVTLTREELESKPEYDAAGQESLPADTQLTTLMGEGETSAPAGDAAVDAPAELDGPVTEAPAMEAPATDGASTEAPMNNAPIGDASSGDTPATDAPATDAPATDQATETETDTEMRTTTD